MKSRLQTEWLKSSSSSGETTISSARSNSMLGSQSEEVGLVVQKSLSLSEEFQSLGISPPMSSPLLIGQGSFVMANSLDGNCGEPVSCLLDFFRNGYVPLLQLSALKNHIIEFARDQRGSRFIQHKLEGATEADAKMVFGEVLPNAQMLIFDVFGNYVKFFEIGTKKQKEELVGAIKGNALGLALQMYGCRVLQTAFRHMDSDQQMDILLELEDEILRCSLDQNGNHVVQKIIECVEPKNLQLIVNAFVNGPPNTVFLFSIHSYGCRVIQRILEFCQDKQKRPILNQLHTNIEALIKHQYGNYVIQHIIEFGSQEDKDRVVEHIKDHTARYAKHKFASNVVEKCLLFGLAPHKRMLILSVCGDRNNATVFEMLKDPFANYVVQKMLQTADETYRRKIFLAIKPHFSALRKLSFGKHIIGKLAKYFPKKGLPLAPMNQFVESHLGSLMDA